MSGNHFGNRGHWTKVGGGLLLAGAALLTASPARAADPETRDFTVYVDGKPSGTTTMAISRRDDGSVEMACATNVFVKVLLIKYRYTLQSREVWKEGRLQGFTCRADDNGKLWNVSATTDGSALTVQVNNQAHKVRADAWLTSYWNLPSAAQRDQTLPIIDMDNGTDLSGKLQLLGTQQIGVAGRAVNVTHYRLNTANPVDLWYDASERLVRREFNDQGHRVTVQMTGVR